MLSRHRLCCVMFLTVPEGRYNNCCASIRGPGVLVVYWTYSGHVRTDHGLKRNLEDGLTEQQQNSSSSSRQRQYTIHDPQADHQPLRPPSTEEADHVLFRLGFTFESCTTLELDVAARVSLLFLLSFSKVTKNAGTSQTTFQVQFQLWT